MRDLTERLRSGFGGLVPPVCDEAANVIEALRAERSDALVRVEALESVVRSALKTAEFEMHPFRPWHDAAKVVLAYPLPGAASRLRDEVLEEAEQQIRRGVDDSQGLDYNRGVRWAYEALRAARYRKSKEADR